MDETRELDSKITGTTDGVVDAFDAAELEKAEDATGLLRRLGVNSNEQFSGVNRLSSASSLAALPADDVLKIRGSANR